MCIHFSYMSLNKRSICNNWRHWTLSWSPFLVISHLITMHLYLQGLRCHRDQGLHNPKITHMKQEEHFTRKGPRWRSKFQLPILVTKTWVEFSYSRAVQVALICTSKFLMDKHLHVYFQKFLSSTSEAHSFFFTSFSTHTQEGEGPLFFCLYLSSELSSLERIQDKCSYKLVGILAIKRGNSQFCWHGTTWAGLAQNSDGSPLKFSNIGSWETPFLESVSQRLSLKDQSFLQLLNEVSTLVRNVN